MDRRFYDLDVPLSNASPMLIARILDAGYQYIALSQSVTIDDFNFSLKTNTDATRKKTKDERQSMRSRLMDKLTPPTRDSMNAKLSDSFKYRTVNWSPEIMCSPRLFRRLNLCCSEPSLAGMFFREFGEMLNRFDIVSMCPASPGALVYACESAPSLDLITLDLSNPGDLRLTSRQCSLILSRGLRLEFQLRSLFHSGSSGTTARSTLAYYLVNLLSGVRLSFNRSIVVSSGATVGWEVRRPLAVIAILQCLGLTPLEVAQNALTRGPYSAITHGLSRSRTCHGTAALLSLLSNPSVVFIDDIDGATATKKESPPKKKQCVGSPD